MYKRWAGLWDQHLARLGKGLRETVSPLHQVLLYWQASPQETVTVLRLPSLGMLKLIGFSRSREGKKRRQSTVLSA